MALVSRGWFLTMGMVDCGGNQITKTWQLRSADAAAAAIDGAAIRAAFNAVTGSVEVAYSIGERFEENSITYPAAGVENENKASLTLLLTTGNKKANIKIPAPVIGIFMNATGPGANTVDILDVDLNTYTDVFKDAAEAYVSDGEDLDFLLSGKRVHSKSSKG